MTPDVSNTSRVHVHIEVEIYRSWGIDIRILYLDGNVCLHITCSGSQLATLPWSRTLIYLEFLPRYHLPQNTCLVGLLQYLYCNSKCLICFPLTYFTLVHTNCDGCWGHECGIALSFWNTVTIEYNVLMTFYYNNDITVILNITESYMSLVC
jgi:hypothetical protein